MNASEKRLLESGLGNITWWGFSPAYLLPDAPEKLLILGASDGRHFLNRLLSDAPSSSFWILEQNLMTYARQILFATLISRMHLQNYPSKDLAKVFLEIYGNVSLSKKAAIALSSTAKYLLKWIREEEKNAASEAISIDLSQLKHKEIDTLEAIFKIWCGADGCTSTFAKQAFETRTKEFLQDRFENKDGVFDMDYQFRLTVRGGELISLKEYRLWRATGIAYEWQENDDTELYDNLTIISSIPIRERHNFQKGYWGDIITGPFISFGTDEAKKVSFEELNFKRTSQEHSLDKMEILFEEACRKIEKGNLKMCLTFLPMNTDHFFQIQEDQPLNSFSKKHLDSFDCIFVSCSLTHLLSPNLTMLLRQDARIFIETPSFLLHMTDDVLETFRQHVASASKKCSLFPVQIKEDRQNVLIEMKKTVL